MATAKTDARDTLHLHDKTGEREHRDLCSVRLASKAVFKDGDKLTPEQEWLGLSDTMKAVDALGMGTQVVATRYFGLWAPKKGGKSGPLRACAMVVFAKITQAKKFVKDVTDAQLNTLRAVVALGGVTAQLRMPGSDFRAAIWDKNSQ